jgi:hypothetical protein
MPIEELHKRKFKKNFAIFAMIMSFMAVIWAITMIKIGNNKAQTAAQETSMPAPAPAVE